jgi:hypothetical protein
VAAPRLADNLDLYWNQQLLDVLLEYPNHSDRSEFAIRMRVDRFGQNVSTARASFRPKAPRARSIFTAIRAWCASIRAGTTLQWPSSCPGSGTSSKAAVTYCSYAAW